MSAYADSPCGNTALAEAARAFEADLDARRVNFRARARMLTLREWAERGDKARDLRTSGGYHWSFRDHKYEYDWAVDAWLFGRLTAGEFLSKARLFDTSIALFKREAAERDADLVDKRYSIGGWDNPHGYQRESWVKDERRRLRRLARDGYVDRDRWLLVTRRDRQLQEERETWRQELRRRKETARQRRYLRQGARTLAALRRHLRAPGRSPLPESALARISPTL